MKNYMTGKLAFLAYSGHFGLLREQHNVRTFHEHDSFEIKYDNEWLPIIMEPSLEGWVLFCLSKSIMDKIPMTGVEIRIYFH